jgi:two-component system sensor histidine kinase BaeS
MFKSLWAKFFVLLLVVSLIGLSAAFYTRQMMLGDFEAYLDGERLDRVYLITANLEGGYEQWSGWNEMQLKREIIRALMMGMVTRVRDSSGKELIDTAEAVEGLTPLMKRRVLSLVDMNARTPAGDFVKYPLFLAGEKIGSLEVRFFPRDRADLFNKRSIRFLLIAFLTMGGLAVFASIVFSRKLTLPIKRLEEQTRSIREGDFTGRVDLSGIDEIGSLSHSFNEMADDLQLQESLRRKLIANIAHELRTPLAAMRGELEGMIDGMLASDEDQLRSLYEETGRLRNMLDGIDDLTQAQASYLTLEKQQVELAGFLGNIGDRFRARAVEEGVRIQVEVEEGSTAWADPDRLSQIVINLLENAIRATPESGIVTLRSGPEEKGAFIEVDDTGEGIEEKDIPVIFERFYSGPGGGLGLGLTIVRELVDAHKGEITVHSEVGKGTKVRVTLPGSNEKKVESRR